MRALYSHPAKEWTDPDTRRRECRVCGGDLTGNGVSLRHRGEKFATTAPEPEDAAAFSAALRVAEESLLDLVAEEDRQACARAAVEGLYRAGALRSRPAPRRNKSRKQLALY